MQIPNDLLLTINSTLEIPRSRKGTLTYARGVRFREPDKPGAWNEQLRSAPATPDGASGAGPGSHCTCAGAAPLRPRGRENPAQIPRASVWAGLTYGQGSPFPRPRQWRRLRTLSLGTGSGLAPTLRAHGAGSRLLVPTSIGLPPPSPTPGRKARALRRLYLAVHLALFFHVDMGEFGRGGQ